MTTSAPGTPPLVVAYLADLERALAGTDPHERADTLAAIREHIEDALDGTTQDTAATMAVLAGLGPVERIAATATPAHTPAVAPTPTVAPTSAPTRERVSLALLGCAVASLALVFALPWVATPIAVVTLVVAIMQLRRHAGREGFLRTSVVLSIATILVSALLALGLFTTGSPAPVPDGIESVQPNDE